jgi:signal peptidase I
MSILHHIHAYFYQHFGDSMYYILGFFLVLSVVAQWRLYEKAGQPGVAAVVPIWNFIVFLRIVGRPANHLWLFLIPVFGQLYMIPKVWIELCQSFGKRSLLDYVLVILLNGLYIFNLGMSYDTEYLGPVYGKHIPENDNHAHPSLA